MDLLHGTVCLQPCMMTLCHWILSDRHWKRLPATSKMILGSGVVKLGVGVGHHRRHLLRDGTSTIDKKFRPQCLCQVWRKTTIIITNRHFKHAKLQKSVAQQRSKSKDDSGPLWRFCVYGAAIQASGLAYLVLHELKMSGRPIKLFVCLLKLCRQSADQTRHRMY